MNGANQSGIRHIIEKINEFINERDWKQFRNHKDMAISVAVEAAELLEHFQWKNGEDLLEHIEKNKNEIGEEIADIAIYLFEMADNIGIELEKKEITDNSELKDMAITIFVEAAELPEYFRWEKGEGLIERAKKGKGKLSETMLNLAARLFKMAENMNIDLIEAIEKKIIKNGIKYPVEKVKGKNKKYRELE